MNRRGRRDADSNKNISMIFFATIIIIAIASFIVSYVLYSGRLSARAKTITNNNTQKISSTSENNMINMIDNTEAASSSIGKSVNELENTTTDIKNNENTEKIAVNTSNIEKKQTENKQTNENKNESDEDEQEPQIEEVAKAPSFIKPVEGEKLKDYSKDNLIYSSTLDEWTTHLGIDFAAEKTDVVKASANGKIKSIKNDPRYGLTVVIEHENGFESIYSSLLTAEFVKVGEEIEQGQTIATVGNTARFEIADETHLHFEIKKDGINVDPNIYIK